MLFKANWLPIWYLSSESQTYRCKPQSYVYNSLRILIWVSKRYIKQTNPCKMELLVCPWNVLLLFTLHYPLCCQLNNWTFLPLVPMPVLEFFWTPSFPTPHTEDRQPTPENALGSIFTIYFRSLYAAILLIQATNISPPGLLQDSP